MTDPQPSLWDIPRQTRRAAKAKADETAARNRALLLAAYRAHGPMTSDQAGAMVGLGHIEARPRVSELHKKLRLLRPVGRGKSVFGNACAIYEVVR